MHQAQGQGPDDFLRSIRGGAKAQAHEECQQQLMNIYYNKYLDGRNRGWAANQQQSPVGMGGERGIHTNNNSA